MTNNHTPGPWNYRKTGTWPETNHHLGIYADDAVMPQVAKVEGMGIVSDANARLIAAAPDLLEALKVCATLINIQNGNLHQDVNAILDMAKYAVDKAEGRS